MRNAWTILAIYLEKSFISKSSEYIIYLHVNILKFQVLKS